jgi:hypothetical protein
MRIREAFDEVARRTVIKALIEYDAAPGLRPA